MLVSEHVVPSCCKLSSSVLPTWRQHWRTDRRSKRTMVPGVIPAVVDLNKGRQVGGPSKLVHVPAMGSGPGGQRGTLERAATHWRRG